MTEKSRLTKAQWALLKASEPDDVTGEEGVAVQLVGGADYAVARALVRQGLGVIGEACGPSYWNNAAGLSLLGEGE
jgi:hypothetical protein